MDNRIEVLANNLVNYSTKVQKGEKCPYSNGR